MGPEHFLAHLDHIVKVAGIDNVGIGTDWGADLALAGKLNTEMEQYGFRPEHCVDWRARMKGFETWLDWPNLTAALQKHGYSEEDVRKILGETSLGSSAGW